MAEGLGCDVYATMAREAKQEKAVSGYAGDSSEYVMRTYARANLLEK